MNLDKAIQSRHSVRKFKTKKPDWRDIIECIDAARYAPMAGGNFTLNFIVVDDKDKIQKIAQAAQQPFIAKAHYVVVACSNLARTLNAYEGRGETYVRQQAGAGIQNFLLKIEEVGLSACWVGAFVEEQVKRILKIPENINVEALLPIGYEFEKPRGKRTKIELDRFLHFNTYGNKKMKEIKKLDV